jgi:hypothetical protein
MRGAFATAELEAIPLDHVCHLGHEAGERCMRLLHACTLDAAFLTFSLMCVQLPTTDPQRSGPRLEALEIFHRFRSPRAAWHSSAAEPLGPPPSPSPGRSPFELC